MEKDSSVIRGFTSNLIIKKETNVNNSDGMLFKQQFVM